MCFSLIFILIGVFVGEPMTYIMFLFASIPIIVSICICINKETSIYFILGPNNIKVIKNHLCRKKDFFYNSGELLRVEFQ